MSIVQNLKVLNKPIAELAMLPQEAIIQLAQSGQIPVGFVAPILGEKAEQSKAAAALAAMRTQQQMPAPTVLEGIIAQNAMGEMQAQMPPPDRMTEAGVAALPAPNMESIDMAGGGIVAFQGGGASSLEDKFRQRQELYKQFVGENEAAQKELAGMDAEAAQQRAMRLIEAGLGIASGTSPYFAANLKGAMPAIQGYAGDIAEQRKRRSALSAADRAERLKLFEGTLSDEAKQAQIDATIQAANISAGKPTDQRSYIEDYVKAARATGDTKTPESVLRQKGANEYLSRYGAAETRARAAVSQAETAGTKVEQTAREKAVEAVDRAIAPGGNRTQQREYNRRDREDRLANEKSGAQPGDPNYSNKAEEYRQRLIEDRLKTTAEPTAAKPTAAKPTAAKPAAAPAGLPAGATYMGTSGGKPVYKLPNGKMVIQE
jgi:hypothetical protein